MTKKLYAVVDIETTGTDRMNDSVFDVCVLITDGKVILDTYQSYIYIEEGKINFAIDMIGHIVKIDKEKILQAPKIDEFINSFINYLYHWYDISNQKLYFVAHGAMFDYEMLLYTLEKYSQKAAGDFKRIFANSIIDTYTLCRAIFPDLKSYSLNAIVEHFKIATELKKERDIEKHSALLDCKILYELLIFILKSMPLIG